MSTDRPLALCEIFAAIDRGRGHGSGFGFRPPVKYGLRRRRLSSGNLCDQMDGTRSAAGQGDALARVATGELTTEG